MADTLKRTFHGCLTCRKRKVRCLGGSPCQNCSRMNITCHSSFETNLRIRVSTPTGQKVVDSKPAPIRGLRRLPQPPASTPPAATPSFNDTSQNENHPPISFEPHFSSFSLSQPPPPPPSGYVASMPPIQQFTTTTTTQPQAVLSLPSFDSGLYTWNGGFDFTCIDPSLETAGGFSNSFNNHTSSLGVMSHNNNNNNNNTDLMGYADLMSGLPAAFTGGAQIPSLLSENGFLVGFPAQEGGTREWVPKRRRRGKKVVDRKGGGGGGGGGGGWGYQR
ncbi:hypothetical protein QBC41DRAFT_234085 [Cercophora samala]|uniref:Zn(2)-C6 fungal-type domain-containing protein n=1 Tax=Cercophora samala TaxID=330535 RepID=A0AA39Z4R8_9PEZI|nr:hypothetical protein QBC41DRAFT_234085 [Cercophora samala]